MYSYPHFFKPTYNPYPYMQMDYQTIQYQLYLQYQNQYPQFRPAPYQQTQQPVQQQNIITISDDEEKVPNKEVIKPTPKEQIQSVQTLKHITKMLDIDQLEASGKLYDCESSPPPPLPKRIIQKPKKLIQKQEKKRKNKIKRYPVKRPIRCIKQVQISKDRQQLLFPQSSIKVRLIKVYERNDDQFLKLYEKLKLNFPQANDEDVVILLNICNKDYFKAESLIQESGCFISYYLNSQKDQQIDETTQRK
ncbi:unnamed protein product [Paramecium pentaurelia]|uniref:Uncharacterized protein n=1 Tax=Paramecium pentaurelia TaxID=43138 RepID=A0A8S1YDG4_9CILI|nr:unnamed protein product [Paramecium pentaurelia]